MYQPAYTIDNEIISRIAAVSELAGRAEGMRLHNITPQLRKQNRIKTIHATLQIEGNTLQEAQITAILEGKHVAGPARDVREVQNALAAYDMLQELRPYKLKDLLKAHRVMMQGLVADAGSLRTGNVGIKKGAAVLHAAPPAAIVRGLMKDLFTYLKKSTDIWLLKSCVFHYELEFIHPFTDGNGRMGRLWQTLLLMQQHSFYAYVPVETLIRQDEAAYYAALAASDKSGSSNAFIKYMLGVIQQALEQLPEVRQPRADTLGRLEMYREVRGNTVFTRKDYMGYYTQLGSATASRDLKWGAEHGLLTRSGDKRLAMYVFNEGDTG